MMTPRAEALHERPRVRGGSGPFDDVGRVAPLLTKARLGDCSRNLTISQAAPRWQARNDDASRTAHSTLLRSGLFATSATVGVDSRLLRRPAG